MLRVPVPVPSRGSRLVAVTVALAVLVLASGALAGCLQPFHSPGTSGAWALEFLRDDKYSDLLVEIDHESGAGPQDATLSMLRNTLERRLNKPGGIDIRTSAEIDGKGKGAKYSFNEIRDMEEEYRDHHKGDDRAVMYVMFVDGGSNQDTSDGRVLGAVYTGSSMVMFKDNLRFTRDRCQERAVLPGSPIDNCPSLNRIEDAVVTHEVGHVLGLVNLNPEDVPMQNDREDPESPGHSIHEDSVMYHAVRTSGGILGLLQNRSLPTEYDQYDLRDLRNAGGK